MSQTEKSLVNLYAFEHNIDLFTHFSADGIQSSISTIHSIGIGKNKKKGFLAQPLGL
jgi:hypothetical protein